MEEQADNITTVNNFYGLTLDIARVNNGEFIGVWVFLTNNETTISVRYGINTSTKLAELLASEIVLNEMAEEDEFEVN